MVLYEEHLHSSNGIDGDERVDEQVGVHDVSGTATDGNATGYHSTIHVGELHWETDPTSATPGLDDRTSLDVEVDWIEGHDPANRTIGGQPMLDAIEDNYRLYGFDVMFHRDERLSRSQVTGVCKVGPRRGNCLQTVTLPGLNAEELNELETEFHDDEDKLHLLFATEYTTDSPKYLPHDLFIPSGVDGLEGHTGSPGQIAILGGSAPYGTVILAEEPQLSTDATAMSITMHELGHALSIGWADDKDAPLYSHVAECYSGQDCIGQFGVGGGDDQTPERVDLQPTQSGGIVNVWSIMARTDDPRRVGGDRFVYSIEELSTVDFEDIPAANG